MYRLNNVSFSYDDHLILKNLTLQFPDFGLVVILGKSGCGKTTFLSLLSGVLKPTSGTIEGFREAKPAIVFQSPLLLNYLDTKENACLCAELYGMKEKGDDILRRVGLSDMTSHDVTTMSGGEQMRLSIARALLSDSPVLILDEPTGQQDEKNAKEIYRILKDLAKDHLLILVTHDEKNAEEIADFLYLMDKGELTLKKGSGLCPSKAKANIAHDDISFGFASLLAKKYLRRKSGRVRLATIFLAFIMSLFYLGMELKLSLPQTMNSFLSEYYAYEVNTISAKEEIAESGRLHLERSSVPSEEQLALLKIKETYTPLSFFLPETNEVTIKGVSKTVSFRPFFHQDQTRLKAGSISHNAKEVIVNESFLSEFGFSDLSQAIDFSLSSAVLISSSSLSSSDLVSLNDHFSIVGLGKEKKAFNQPVVYYSYFDYYARLSDEYLKNISIELDQLISIADLLHDPAYDNDDFKGQSKLFLKENVDEQLRLAHSIYPDTIKITSQALTLKSSTSELLSSLTQILLMFLALNLISAFMLEFLIVYSLYEENIRLFALEKAFQASKKTKLCILSALQFRLLKRLLMILFPLCLILSSGINLVLHQLNMPSFLASFNLSLFLLISLGATIVSLLSSLLPLRWIKDSELKKELEGED